MQSFNLQLRQTDVNVVLRCQQQRSVSVSPKHVDIHILHVCRQCDTTSNMFIYVGEGADNVHVSISQLLSCLCSLTAFVKIKYRPKFPDLDERNSNKTESL